MPNKRLVKSKLTCYLTSFEYGKYEYFVYQAGVLLFLVLDQLIPSPKGPCRHKETWWWHEDVAEAVREKKIMYGKWKKENTKEARMEYKKSRQNAKRVISSAKEKKQKE